jgi:hypothetical protein
MTKFNSRRPWLQFSLRTLLFAMLAVAAFFAGRMSLRPELERAEAVQLEALRAHARPLAAAEAAMMAEQDARYPHFWSDSCTLPLQRVPGSVDGASLAP